MMKIQELGFTKVIAMVLIVGLVFGFMGLSILFSKAQAASLTNAKDTISDSDLAVAANHAIEFITQSAITASSTIVIDFDDLFISTSSPAFANTDAIDYDIATSTGDAIIYAAGGCTEAASSTAFEITTISSANVFTFTHCSGSDDLASGDTVTIEIGTNATAGGNGNSQLVNPNVAASYTISITAPSGDSADVMVAIIDDVVVTATVSATLTFVVSSVASGQTVNVATTDIGSTATTIPFGTLVVGTSVIIAQDLAVTTNADDGFTVTMFQDQNLTNAGASDINGFQTAADTWVANSAPAVWVDPDTYDVLDDVSTYGHFGYTTQDSSLGTGTVDRFTDTGNEWASFTTSDGGTSTNLEIFYHDGPANGTTAHKGATRIGFQVEITALQEAGDYTNSLTYIATPTY